MQQRDRATEGRARSAECDEREPIFLPQPFDLLMALSLSNGPISVFGSQALIVKPPALNRQNPEHYRGVPPWLGGAAVSAAPS